MLDKTKPDLSKLFDHNSEWKHYSEETCRQLGFFPNQLAYSEEQATFCLIIKQSRRGGDCPLSKAGADFLTNAEKKGRKDGKPVHHCLVVQVAYEPSLKSQGGMPYRLLGHSTIEETMRRIELCHICINENGLYGDFWWIPTNCSSHGDMDELALNDPFNLEGQ